MIWPFNRKNTADDNPDLETRSFSSVIEAGIESEASGTVLSSAGTIAESIVSGFYSRSLMAATVEPISMRDTITPSLLESIATGLVRDGNALFEIVVNGSLQLRSISTYDIEGGPDERLWRYKITVPGPTKSIEKEVGSEQIIHIKTGSSVNTPWQGCSPLKSAATTAKLASIIERKLQEESSTATGYVIPLPEGSDDFDDAAPTVGLAN